MHLHKISELFVAAVAALYEEGTVRLHLVQGATHFSPYNHGVIQDDSISALLYILFYNLVPDVLVEVLPVTTKVLVNNLA